MKNYLLVVVACLVCMGCSLKEINVNPNDPLQKSVIISTTRLGVSAYLTKNDSEESIKFVGMLGKFMSSLDTPENQALSTVEIQSEMYDKIFNEFGSELKPLETEAIRSLLDTTMAAVYQYASKNVKIEKKYLQMIALVGVNIVEVVKTYEVTK